MRSRVFLRALGAVRPACGSKNLSIEGCSRLGMGNGDREMIEPRGLKRQQGVLRGSFESTAPVARPAAHARHLRL